jgi:outer membrane receptor for ferrienterochelin and colicins
MSRFRNKPAHSLSELCRLGPLCALLLSLHPAAASAQEVDYGTLEQIFGEPITTSVTGKPQRASDVPGDLVIITQDDIRRSGATDIPGVLQFVTGIDVRQYTFSQSEIGIRGYGSVPNPRLLVLVDGRQVYLDDYGYVAWNTIPVQLTEIRQIEIVKGPASALFGFNAASGVINIVTYDPLLDNRNGVDLRGGTQGYGGADAVATLHFGQTAGVRVSLGGWTATGFDSQQGAAEPAPERYGSFNIDARWQATANILVRMSGGMTDARDERFVETNALETQDQLNFWRIGAVADTRAGAIDLDLYRNQAFTNYGIGGLLNDTNDVFVSKLSDVIRIGTDSTVRLGLEYRNNGIEFQVKSSGAASYDNYAASGIWEWQIAPYLDFTNAVQLDHLVLHDTGALIPSPGRDRATYNATTITDPSFNSGLVIRLSDKDTVRITAARGLQLPSLFDFALQIPVGPLAYLGSPSVLPTSIWDAELAYDRRIRALDSVLTTAFFWQRSTDLIANPGIGTETVVNGQTDIDADNDGSSYELGVELGVRGSSDAGFRWNLSYAYSTIHDDITASIANSAVATGSFDSGTPLSRVILGGGYSGGRWEFDVQGRFQSRYLDTTMGPHGPQTIMISKYVTANARIGYRAWDHLTIAGTVQQLNAARLVETAGDYIERRFIASATWIY